MLISVILCTYNPNESYLARALDAILAQDLASDEWELLVVDNNSSVSLGDRGVVRDRGVRVVFEGRQGLSAARECGLRQSSGDLIVFVDDDNLLATDYLLTVKNVFATPNVGVVSGAIIPEYEAFPAAWFSEFQCMLAIRPPRGERVFLTSIPLYNEFFPIGAGMAVRRKVVEDYYEAIANGSTYISGRKGDQLSSAEDLDLDFYAISQGYLIGTVGNLTLTHIIPAGRTTLDYITRLAVASETCGAEVNRKWKDTFGSDLFTTYTVSRKGILLRMVVCGFLSWLPKFRIRYHVFRTRYSLLGSR